MFVCRHPPEKMDVHSYAFSLEITHITVTCTYCGMQREYVWDAKELEATA